MSMRLTRGAFVLRGTFVKTTAGNHVITSRQSQLVVKKTVSEVTGVTLPRPQYKGHTVIVKDGKGDAGAFPITITPSGVYTVDGAATYVVSEPYGVTTLTWNGTEWNVVRGVGQMRVRKAVADNTATNVITVTVPNANHAAAIRLTMMAYISTGTDAFESARVATGTIVLARTPGAAVVAVVSTIAQEQIATVSGGATITLAYGVSAITGAVGVANTFTVQVTVARSAGTSTHHVVVLAELINAEAPGVTLAAA